MSTATPCVEDYLPWTADEFPPGTFAGFTHEMMLDVRAAARDAAQEAASRHRLRLRADRILDPQRLSFDALTAELDRLDAAETTITTGNGQSWARVPAEWFEGIAKCWREQFGAGRVVSSDYVASCLAGAVLYAVTPDVGPGWRTLDPDSSSYAETIAELNSLPLWTDVTDSGGWSWRRCHNGIWSGPDGLVETEHMIARSKGVLTVVSSTREG